MIAASIQAIFWTLGMFLWSHFIRSSGSGAYDWTVSVLSLTAAGVMFGLLMYFVSSSRLFKSKRSLQAHSSIAVECDRVTWSCQSSDGTLIREAVLRKGMVRSIFRVPGGIGVSERKQFAARMLGFIVIPNTLPKFEELRTLLESWRADDSRARLPQD
jgi:hypothetical protein